MINKTWSVFMHFFSGCDSLAVNSGWFRLFRHEISPPPRVCFVHQIFVQQRWLCIILVSGLILAQKFLEFRYRNPSKIDQSWLSTKHTQLVGSIYLPLQGTKISHLGKRKIIFPATFKGDMFVPRRVYIERGDSSSSDKVRFFSNTKAVKIWTNPVGSHSTTGGFRDSPSCCESKPLPHATHCSWYSIWAKRAKLSKNRGTVICWKKTFEFRGGAWTKPLEGFLARIRSLEPQT